MIITQDLHVHTNLSPCASREATVESFFDAMIGNGISTVGIADHLWDESMPNPCPGRTPAVGMGPVLELKEKLKSMDTKGLRILVGGETEYDYKNRGVAISEESAAKLDFLLVPNAHTHLTMPKEWWNDKKKHARFTVDAWFDIINSNIAKYTTAIPHPFVTGAPEEVTTELSDATLRECMIAAKEADIAVEINSAALLSMTKTRSIKELLDLDAMRILSIAKECGCKFTFGSDAHEASAARLFYANYIVAASLEICESDILKI
jgi:histidinol phosphatase-like PHP family hydrolase